MIQSIYINKSNWASLEKEESKSKLINDLLKKHYSGVPEKKLSEPKLNDPIKAELKRRMGI